MNKSVGCEAVWQGHILYRGVVRIPVLDEVELVEVAGWSLVNREVGMQVLCLAWLGPNRVVSGSADCTIRFFDVPS